MDGRMDGRTDGRFPPSFSYGTCGFQKNTFFHFWNCYFDDFLLKTCFPKVLFRFLEPSKKLGHVVRISLVQFSASELHEVSSYDRLKIQKVKFRILRRQHLLRIVSAEYWPNIYILDVFGGETEYTFIFWVYFGAKQHIGFSEFYRSYRLYRLCRFYRVYRVFKTLQTL